jgi:hypothetical protein
MVEGVCVWMVLTLDVGWVLVMVLWVRSGRRREGKQGQKKKESEEFWRFWRCWMDHCSFFVIISDWADFNRRKILPRERRPELRTDDIASIST